MRPVAARDVLLPMDGRDDAYAPLLARVAVGVGRVPGSLGLAVWAPNSLTLGDGFAGAPGASILLRFGLELAVLRSLPALPAASATLLAARAAGMALDVLPLPARKAALDNTTIRLLARLAGDLPPIAQLAACWRLLAEAMASQEIPPDLQALQLVSGLWHLAAPTEALLVAGGDDRLTLDSATGQNRYLCAPYPNRRLISFASCTASSISEQAFAAAEDVRQHLLAASCTLDPDEVLERASDQIIAELLVQLEIDDIAEVALAASGTDATLLLTGMLAAERPRDTITTVLMSPSETGSGVPEAVQGRHFAPCTASGVAVEKGGTVDGFPPGLALVTVALRDEMGLPRPEEAIASEAEAAIEAACARGHVVLHAIDGSKTGLAAPGLLALDMLAARFGDRLDIVVDACQLRIEPALVRRYLERGWPVLVTGSKFFGAPGFCGAVLFPRQRLRRIAGRGRLPNGLGAYASLSGGMVSRRCPGLLLRWAAALSHMRDFHAMDAGDIRAAIDQAGGHVRAALMRDPRLRLVPAPRPEGLGAGAGWSDRPSVLTFAIRGAEGMMTPDALRPYYKALARDMADALPGPREVASQLCLLGQPVQLGPRHGGLRVAISAAQIAGSQDLRQALASTFGKLAMLLDNPPPL